MGDKVNLVGDVVRITDLDNVATVVNLQGMSAGSHFSETDTVREFIPMGHKVALIPIEEGQSIIKYGTAIGKARCAIKPGDWVHFKNMELIPAPEVKHLPGPVNSGPLGTPLEGYTFEGYKNKDGSTGTKNVLAIATSVQCVAGMAEHLAHLIKRDLLQFYPNVDDVVAINHSYGCGIAMDSALSAIPVRTLQNLLRNPNFGNEVMVLGLGCEKLRPEQLVSELRSEKRTFMYLQDPEFNGFGEMVEGALKMAKDYLQRLNARKRATCPASDLVVGMQCGGSDGLSGITGNPVAGFAADLLVRAGASVMFSEITEVRDALHVLTPRIEDGSVRKKLIDEISWYDQYLKRGRADRSANPTPGNRQGGLSNVIEKAMGSIAKSGSSPIVDVLSPGERIRKPGMTFAATPASDFICGTLQLAAGMNLHVFITGRGSPYGLPMVPVIKISSNSRLSRQWHDLIDINAGAVADGDKSIEQMGWELFHYMLDVASGKRQVACDRLGLHNDLVLFNPGPVT